MKIITIFSKYLFAVKYDDETYDEFERLFDLWSDVEYLEEFFGANKHDLKNYGLNVEEAIWKTLDEAKSLRKRMLGVIKDDTSNLDSLFQNLYVHETRLYELAKQKSKQRWLRLYAIRIDANIYLITGGAIKLTLRMEERYHTKNELTKLEECRIFLKENGVFDDESFEEMLT